MGSEHVKISCSEKYNVAIIWALHHLTESAKIEFHWQAWKGKMFCRCMLINMQKKCLLQYFNRFRVFQKESHFVNDLRKAFAVSAFRNSKPLFTLQKLWKAALQTGKVGKLTVLLVRVFSHEENTWHMFASNKVISGCILQGWRYCAAIFKSWLNLGAHFHVLLKWKEWKVLISAHKILCNYKNSV